MNEWMNIGQVLCLWSKSYKHHQAAKSETQYLHPFSFTYAGPLNTCLIQTLHAQNQIIGATATYGKNKVL